jgi:hypothetical protein
VIIPVKSRGRAPVEILSVPNRTCNVRGGMISSHLAWVEKVHGEGAVAEVWNRLPEPLRVKPPSAIEPHDWVPFEHVIALDRAIARTFGQGREERIAIELGRFSALRNFVGKGLDLSKGVNVHSHFWSGKDHHALFQDFGSCTYVPLEEQAFRMEYRDYPVMSRVFCVSAYGYFEASIELFGGEDTIVEETTCQCYGDEACAFVISWER